MCVKHRQQYAVHASRTYEYVNSFKHLVKFLAVNAVINCAGIGMARKTLSKSREPDSAGQLIPHSLHEFTKALTINTVGTFNVARLAAQRMASRDADRDGLRGCIINTASIAAMDGQRGQVAYATSKAALVGMTLPMARDLSLFGIRVMAIVSVCVHFPSNGRSYHTDQLFSNLILLELTHCYQPCNLVGSRFVRNSLVGKPARPCQGRIGKDGATPLSTWTPRRVR